MKFGAEATTEDAKDDAEEEQWELAEHFKLRLHPAELRATHKISTKSKCPNGKSPRKIGMERAYSLS